MLYGRGNHEACCIGSNALRGHSLLNGGVPQLGKLRPDALKAHGAQSRRGKVVERGKGRGEGRYKFCPCNGRPFAVGAAEKPIKPLG